MSPFSFLSTDGPLVNHILLTACLRGVQILLRRPGNSSSEIKILLNVLDSDQALPLVMIRISYSLSKSKHISAAAGRFLFRKQKGLYIENDRYYVLLYGYGEEDGSL